VKYFTLIAAGHQNREIATQLGISPRTVRSQGAHHGKARVRLARELIRMNLAPAKPRDPFKLFRLAPAADAARKAAGPPPADTYGPP